MNSWLEGDVGDDDDDGDDDDEEEMEEDDRPRRDKWITLLVNLKYLSEDVFAFRFVKFNLVWTYVWLFVVVTDLLVDCRGGMIFSSVAFFIFICLVTLRRSAIVLFFLFLEDIVDLVWDRMISNCIKDMSYGIDEFDVITISSDYCKSSNLVCDKPIYEETHVLGHHNRGFLNIGLQLIKTVIFYIK